MKRMAMLTVGSLVGTALTLGVGGVALAAPVTTATTATSSPTTSSPSTTNPATSSPSTTNPATSSPSTTNPTKRTAAPRLLTGAEIWRIVEPHHKIVCSEATKEVPRIHRAEAAAAKRLAHAQTRNGTAERNAGRNAARRTKKTAGAARGFQKLEQDGAALIKKIDAKCAVNSSTS